MNVCFWHKADIDLSRVNVRFWGCGHCDEAAKTAWWIAANIAELPSLLR
jgi:hypothetical protein